jgi:uncharacterized phosphosugar-binding protein
MSFANHYFARIRQLLDEIEIQEISKIRQIAKVASQSVMDGGILHFFGSGHSAIPTQEVYIRAGCLTNTRPISLERNLDRFEGLEGIGEALMSGFDGKPGELLVVFSNSGVNPLPIEVALVGKRMGLYTVSVSSFDHSRQSRIKHSGGKKLHEVTDVAIDSHVPYGDAGLEAEGIPMHFGPLSTIAGVAIVNSLMAETIATLHAAGAELPVRISRNTPGGMAKNAKFIEKYADRIPELRF